MWPKAPLRRFQKPDEDFPFPLGVDPNYKASACNMKLAEPFHNPEIASPSPYI
jgi:hypothetical protein